MSVHRGPASLLPYAPAMYLKPEVYGTRRLQGGQTGGLPLVNVTS